MKFLAITLLVFPIACSSLIDPKLDPNRYAGERAGDGEGEGEGEGEGGVVAIIVGEGEGEGVGEGEGEGDVSAQAVTLPFTETFDIPANGAKCFAFTIGLAETMSFGTSDGRGGCPGDTFGSFYNSSGTLLVTDDNGG